MSAAKIDAYLEGFDEPKRATFSQLRRDGLSPHRSASHSATGWDIGPASGQDTAITAGLTETAYRTIYSGFTDEHRKGGFKPEIEPITGGGCIP